MRNFDFILALSGSEAHVITSETVEIVGVGFIFVMIVLALLAIVTSVIGAIFIRFDAKAAALAPPASAADPKALNHEEEDPVLVAVIAAAVHSVIGDHAHRIVSIRPDHSECAQEGRRPSSSEPRGR